MEKESYFPYGKRGQVGKVSKLFLILILTYGTAIRIFIRTPEGRLMLLKFLCSYMFNTKTIELCNELYYIFILFFFSFFLLLRGGIFLVQTNTRESQEDKGV